MRLGIGSALWLIAPVIAPKSLGMRKGLICRRLAITPLSVHLVT